MTPGQMNQIMAALTTVIVIVLGAVGTFTANYLNAKAEQLKKQTKNTTLDWLIETARDVVLTEVTVVKQTVVDELKKGGLFTKERQDEAFMNCKNAVLKALSEEVKKAIESVYGDYSKWIGSQIEFYVNRTKTYSK